MFQQLARLGLSAAVSISRFSTLKSWLPATVALGLATGVVMAAPNTPAVSIKREIPTIEEFYAYQQWEAKNPQFIKADVPGTKVVDPKAPTPTVKAEKTYTVAFEKTPWSSVFEWFAKESGLTYLGTQSVTGSLTLKSDKKYTLGELLDLLNEALSQQKFIIIRRNQSFVLHPADEKLPRELVTLIQMDELPGRGNTEVVQMIMPLTTVVADDIAPQAKKLISQFGEIAPFGSNQIIILDKAKNVRNLQKYIEFIEKDVTDQFTHVCKYVRANAAAERLRALLIDSTTTVASTVPQSPYDSGFGGFGRFDRFGGGGFGDRGFGGGGDPRSSGGSSSSSRDSRTGSTTEKRFRSVQIAVDHAANTVFLTGPADKMVAAQSLIKNIDKGDTARAIGGKEFWKTYNVNAGTAEALSKTIMDMPEFKGSNVKMIVQNSSQVMAYGYPADHMDIEPLLKMPEGASATLDQKFVAMSGGDPAAVSESVKTGVPGLTVEANIEDPSGIYLRGTSEQIKAAEGIIAAHPKSGRIGAQDPNFRRLSIDKVNPNVLSENIAEMMRKMGYNVNTGPEKKETPKVPGQSQVVPTPGTGKNNVRFASAQIVDPTKSDKKSIIITVINNEIIVTGDDPKAVQLAYELIKLYTTGAGSKEKERYVVFKLKNASAPVAAKLLTEIFNGPQQQQQGGARGGQQGGGRGGQGGGGLGSFNPLALLSQFTGGAAAGPTDPQAGRVRIVAEESSNAIVVVKASDLDMLTIKDLLKNVIDSDEPPEGGVPKTYMIELKYAKASEVSSIIKTIYANRMGGGAGARQQQPQIGFPFAQPQQAQSTSPSLTVDYDINTNRVIVNCTENMFADIKAFAEELDKSAKDSAEVVEIYQPQGITPTQIQQLMDGLAGRQPTQQNQFGSGNRGGFNQGQGGMNQGFGGGGTNFGGNFGGGNFGGGGIGGGNFGGGNFGGGNLGGGGFQRGGTGQGFGAGGTGGGTNFGGGGGRGTGGGAIGGGGGTRGGGGGTRGGGRVNRQVSYLDGGGGRDFFEHRDMDVPSTLTLIYDPETDPREIVDNSPPALYRAWQEKVRLNQNPELQQVKFQQPDMPEVLPLPKQLPQTTLRAPGTDIQIIPLESLGSVIIRGRNKEEVAKVLEQIKEIEKNLRLNSEIKLMIVPLENRDATSLSGELAAIFSRLMVGSRATTLPFGGQQLQGGQAQAQNLSSVILFPLPRQNAIMVGAPESRREYVLEEIKKLDVPNVSQVVTYQLTRASAQIVATQIQNFFNQRYPGEALAANQIRVTFDVSNNSVSVQASPGDQKDIAAWIKILDSNTNASINDVRVFRLRNAYSDDMANILLQSILANVVNPTANATTTNVAGQGGVGGGQQGGQGVGGIQTGGGGGAQGGFGALTGQGQGANAQNGVKTKTTALRFNSGKGTFEAGVLEDVHIVSDARINAIVVFAPEKTMKLIEALVNELDGVAAAKSFVNIFQLKKADAQVVQQLILQLFSGASRTGTGVGGGGAFGGGGLGTTGTAQGTTRPLLTLTANPSDGATLIDLRLTADPRTNSLVVAGSQNDLDLIRAVIAKLEDSEAPQYITEVYKLKNAAAADVVTALQTFMTNQANVFNAQFQATSTFQTLQRQFAMQAEPVSNTILISATPQLFQQIRTLIERVDASPPQVFVQIVIAEVRLTNNEEFGVEVGLQSDVLFNRSVTGGAPGTPGFNFNSTGALPNTTNFRPNFTGFQGLGNLGVGRASAAGPGGLVISAASDSFNLLIRALKSQGRVDVLSRPQLLTTDNQTGFFQVGQSFPTLGGTVVSGTGVSQQNIIYRDLGIVLRITPRISPDNRVLMRVEPQISAVDPTPVILGGGVAQAFDVQTIETTVIANDGETVMLGGLIRKSDTKNENKIPVLGDLPWVGTAFRFRTQQQDRRELIFIMTPHIIRNEGDMAKLVADEARKMNWSLKDLDCIHGHGMDVLSGKPQLTQDETQLGPAPVQTAPIPAPIPVNPGTVTPASTPPVTPNILGSQTTPAPNVTNVTQPVVPSAQWNRVPTPGANQTNKGNGSPNIYRTDAKEGEQWNVWKR